MMVARVLSLLLLSRAAAAQGGQYYAPGQASWLGSSGSDPTPDYTTYFPIIYVIYGPEGNPHVRAIIDENEADCPLPSHKHNATAYLDDHPLMNALVNGNPVNNNEMPYKFPVQVCGLTITKDSIYREAIESGTLVFSYKDKTYEIPRATSNPQRFLLIGDTGLRLKPTNLGLGHLGTDNEPDGPDCTAPMIYGINQCYTNFTEDDLTQSQQGDFQGIDEWYFKEISDSAANEDIDVIVYVGDYLYRQGPCPLNNTLGANCSAVNLPSFMSEPITEGTVMNWVPGSWGDNWWGWWADFFYPAMNLLKSAPIIPTRGNHEICARGGYGYFMFLSPYPIDDYCLDNFPPYSVKFTHEQFLVMDDSAIDPLYGGVDDYKPGQCPGIPLSGTIVPIQENRYNDTSADANETTEQLEIFTSHFKWIETYSQEYDTNFYVGHRPILGIGCDGGKVVTLDWTLQQSLGPTTLDRISGLITGHMHWLEVLQFENDALPAQIVVGHGGTKLIENNINQSSIPYIDLEVGKPEYGIGAKVKRGLTLSEFGYGIMERNEDESYQVSFKIWDTSTSSMEALDFVLSIPKGLRNASADSNSANATEDVGSGGKDEDKSTSGSPFSSGAANLATFLFIVGALALV